MFLHIISFDVERKNNYKWFNEVLIYHSLSQKRPKQSIYHEGVIYLWLNVKPFIKVAPGATFKI